eukprot:15453892-Alexandrium_andersonii.AAC.1
MEDSVRHASKHARTQTIKQADWQAREHTDWKAGKYARKQEGMWPVRRAFRIARRQSSTHASKEPGKQASM